MEQHHKINKSPKIINRWQNKEVECQWGDTDKEKSDTVELKIIYYL